MLDAIVLMIHIRQNYVLGLVCFSFSSPCFVCFPDVPFLLPGVVVFLDQLSPSFSWASLSGPTLTVQSEILEKPLTAASNRCCLSTQHNVTNLLKTQSFSQKPMISHFFAELPNLGISSTPAIIGVLDRVTQQSEWLPMIDASPSPIRGRLSSLSRLPFRGRFGRCLNLINLSSRRHEMSRMHPAT
jgi:hypothetical protein